MTSSEFLATERSVRQMDAVVRTAISNDMLEIDSAARKALSLDLPWLALFIRMRGMANVRGGIASCRGSINSMRGFVDWLRLSQDSPRLLDESRQEWDSLVTTANDLQDRMLKAQQRGLENGWSGEAKEQWRRTTDEHLSWQAGATAALGIMPGRLAEALDGTRTLLVQAAARTLASTIEGHQRASRAVSSNPFNFAVATRTSEVAKSLQQCSETLERLRAEGGWRSVERRVAASMRIVGLDLDRRRSRRNRG